MARQNVQAADLRDSIELVLRDCKQLPETRCDLSRGDLEQQETRFNNQTFEVAFPQMTHRLGSEV